MSQSVSAVSVPAVLYLSVLRLFQNVAFSLMEKSVPQMTGDVKRIVFSNAGGLHIALMTLHNDGHSWQWNIKDNGPVIGEVTARAYDEDGWNYASQSFSVSVDGDKVATLVVGENSDE
jgi:hypothetical protein